MNSPHDINEIKNMVANVRKQAEQATGAVRELGQLLVTGSAVDGRVQVTIRPTGALESVELDPRAMRLPSEELAAAIVEAAKAAEAEAAERIRGIWTDHGIESPIDPVDMIQGDAKATEESAAEKISEALSKLEAWERS